MWTTVSSKLVQGSSRVTFGYKGDAGACHAVIEEAMLGEKEEQGQAPDLASSLQCECVLGLDLPDADLEERN